MFLYSYNYNTDFCHPQRSCEINSRASADLTALHIAAHEGHTALIELLVGYGADLNATVEKGNTALHLILAKQSMKPLDENTPYTLEVLLLYSRKFCG